LFEPFDAAFDGVENVKSEMLSFDVVDGMLVCGGALECGTAVSIYNMGGVLVASAVVASGGEVALPVAGNPRGSYLVEVKNGNRRNIYKVLF
jgi:hypothetical protein